MTRGQTPTHTAFSIPARTYTVLSESQLSKGNVKRLATIKSENQASKENPAFQANRSQTLLSQFLKLYCLVTR